MVNLNLLKYNRHWEKGFFYPFPKQRKIFPSLLKCLPQRPTVEIIGLRRAGKTTLLFQLINHLLEEKVNPFGVWYFTFDEERPKLEDLLEEFSKQSRVDLRREKIYIFLDEVQKLPNFQEQLKVYYDLYPNLKFFISGSTSLFIRKKTQESLAGRITSFYLPPLDFSEYLYFKEKENLLEKPLIFRPEIEREFDLFLESQFVESLTLKESDERKNYFTAIARKIVFEDIPQIFALENPEVLWGLLKIIAQRPGILIDYQALSREVGISNKTLSRYLYYLEEAFLVKKVFNFSRNLITSEKKLKKFYLASPSFSWALADFSDKGGLAENFVLSLKNYRFFWRDSYQHEIDFVAVEGSKITPVEVKYKEEVVSPELKNLLLFARKFKVNQAVLINKTLEKKKKEINGLTLSELPIYSV